MNLETLQFRIYHLLQVAGQRDNRSRIVDFFLIALIFVNVLAVVLESIESLASEYSGLFLWFEIFSVAVFTGEYILRIWSCTVHADYKHPFTGRVRFALTPLILVDLIAVLPFYLPMLLPIDMRILRTLRLIRLLRVFKLNRYFGALSLLGTVFKSKKDELLVGLSIMLTLLFIASVLMYFCERDVQPETFSNIPKSLWWGVSTLTTVGYGDAFPITALGKIIGSVVSILGVGLFALPAGILASGFAEHLKSKSNKESCPHCGKQIESR